MFFETSYFMFFLLLCFFNYIKAPGLCCDSPRVLSNVQYLVTVGENDAPRDQVEREANYLNTGYGRVTYGAPPGPESLAASDSRPEEREPFADEEMTSQQHMENFKKKIASVLLRPHHKEEITLKEVTLTEVQHQIQFVKKAWIHQRDRFNIQYICYILGLLGKTLPRTPFKSKEHFFEYLRSVDTLGNNHKKSFENVSSINEAKDAVIQKFIQEVLKINENSADSEVYDLLLRITQLSSSTSRSKREALSDLTKIFHIFIGKGENENFESRTLEDFLNIIFHNRTDSMDYIYFDLINAITSRIDINNKDDIENKKLYNDRLKFLRVLTDHVYTSEGELHKIKKCFNGVTDTIGLFYSIYGDYALATFTFTILLPVFFYILLQIVLPNTTIGANIEHLIEQVDHTVKVVDDQVIRLIPQIQGNVTDLIKRADKLETHGQNLEKQAENQLAFTQQMIGLLNQILSDLAAKNGREFKALNADDEKDIDIAIKLHNHIESINKMDISKELKELMIDQMVAAEIWGDNNHIQKELMTRKRGIFSRIWENFFSTKFRTEISTTVPMPPKKMLS